MLFYLTLFLCFLYFKIARVYNKEEKHITLILVQNIIIGFFIISVLVYGFLYIQWYFLLISIILSLIIASLMITAVQLGIFIDGKPIIGLKKVYSLTPFLGALIILLSLILWVF